MNKIIFTKGYLKKASRFFKKHPELLESYKKTIRLLEANHRHPSLRLHQIQSQSLWSISINMQYRVTLEFVTQPDGNIVLLSIGDHSIYQR